MGAWAYCRNCGHAISPTLRDKLCGELVCDCGEIREMDKWDRQFAIDEVLDRPDALEAKLEEIAASNLGKHSYIIL